MPWLINRVLATCLLALAGQAGASADEARLLAAMRKAYPATAFERASRTPVPGLYALWMGENVAFVSPRNARYMVFGRLVDLQSMQDVSTGAGRPAQDGGPQAARVRTKPIPRPGALPLGDAITLVRGAGRRKLVVFTDPSCGFCRQLDRELRQLDDVTIYHFLLPFQGEALPLAIWCATDRQTAYAQALAGTLALPATAPTCPHPLERNLALAARLQVQGTPTLLFEDGQMVSGALQATDIAARLASRTLSPTASIDPSRRQHVPPPQP
ncbi:DsbC family protein [Pseudoduganella violacea]|uniref:Thiol:disulfide interchange protein n=1 Tax=Pseudoduganella violacea TaxID=1715466 RepID=A0A7W5BH86_9BURK|nr:DsbC family protein [Pseudoduganella violacea]MBB3122175.1 thiol:disulfide interchange protein DsbC [Pseudoduganella violacea]